MKTYKLMPCVLVFMLLFTVAAASAGDAPKLTFKFRQLHLPGERIVHPSAINNNGVQVGSYYDKQGVQHGYMFDGENLTILDDPNGTDTEPQELPFNSQSEIVGFYTNYSGNTVGFLYDTATQHFADISGPVGATSSGAEGINDQGWIAGWYTDSNDVMHGFLLQGTTYTTLDPPHTTATGAYGINNNGDVAITWVNRHNTYEGSVYNYSTNTYKTLNVPGAVNGSEASFINNEGDVTFWWYDSNFVLHGALYTKYSEKKFTFYTFDYPKAYLTVANGINDNNVFLGQFERKEGSPVLGYIATFK